MRKRPIVAIVGRPNVGKSTLFNRIVGERRAVVHPLPGMTRDRNYANAEYRLRPFTVIDTGGYEDSTESTILQQMRTQSIHALEEADAVIFLTDWHEPDDPADAEILQRLRHGRKPFYLAVNKCEGNRAVAQAYADFSRFGLDSVYPISARDGDGLYDMMDDVTKEFEMWDPDAEDDDEKRISVAIVGRQNVGKSTLLNRLFGEERVIANPMGGTTRDAIDQEIIVDGETFVVIDTAGIRRRGKIERGPEALSVNSSFAAIERAQVAVLVLDATEGITAQDTHIGGYILERRRACVIVINKWDAIKDREAKYKEFVDSVREHFNFLPWAPILTISASTGQRTHLIWNLIRKCALNFRKEFSTGRLNDVLKMATSYISIPTRKGNAVAIKYVTQTGYRPPTLTLFVNDPDFVHFSYRRYLTNQFYAQLGLEGTPLVLKFKRKALPRGWEKNVRLLERRGDPKTHKPLLGLDDEFHAHDYRDDEDWKDFGNDEEFEDDDDAMEVEYVDDGDDDDDE